jgi:hypothetical protein
MPQMKAHAWRQDHPEADVFFVEWIINAPSAHPIWSQYALVLYDLTSPHPAGQPTIYQDGATHEFLLWALDPDHPIATDATIKVEALHLLEPANYGYQFQAASNEAAQARVQEAVDAIVAGWVSPDTDFRQLWNQPLFADAYPLVR